MVTSYIFTAILTGALFHGSVASDEENCVSSGALFQIQATSVQHSGTLTEDQRIDSSMMSLLQTAGRVDLTSMLESMTARQKNGVKLDDIELEGAKLALEALRDSVKTATEHDGADGSGKMGHGACSAVAACDSTFDEAHADLKTQEKKVDLLRNKHRECRTREDELTGENITAHNDLKEFILGLQGGKAELVQIDSSSSFNGAFKFSGALKGDPSACALPTGLGTDIDTDMVDTVEWLQKFAQEAEEAETKYTALEADAQQKAADLDGTKAECTADQAGFEVEYCSWQQGIKVALDYYKKCRAAAVDSCHHVAGEAAEATASSKDLQAAQWIAVCYMEALVVNEPATVTERTKECPAEGKKHMEGSKGAAGDHEGVPAENVAEESDLDGNMPLPGQDGFATQEYHSLPTHGQADAMTHCQSTMDKAAALLALGR